MSFPPLTSHPVAAAINVRKHLADSAPYQDGTVALTRKYKVWAAHRMRGTIMVNGREHPALGRKLFEFERSSFPPRVYMSPKTDTWDIEFVNKLMEPWNYTLKLTLVENSLVLVLMRGDTLVHVVGGEHRTSTEAVELTDPLVELIEREGV